MLLYEIYTLEFFVQALQACIGGLIMFCYNTGCPPGIIMILVYCFLLTPNPSLNLKRGITS